MSEVDAKSVVIPSSPPHPSLCQMLISPSFLLPLLFFVLVPCLQAPILSQIVKKTIKLPDMFFFEKITLLNQPSPRNTFSLLDNCSKIKSFFLTETYYLIDKNPSRIPLHIRIKVSKNQKNLNR